MSIQTQTTMQRIESKKIKMRSVKFQIRFFNYNTDFNSKSVHN